MEQILRSFTLDFFGKGKHKTEPEAFFNMENALLLDVRSREEAGSIAIPMAFHQNVASMNIPIHEIPDRIGEIPKGKTIGVFCPANVRSALVWAYLRSQGFTEVRILLGGYAALLEEVKPGKVLKRVEGRKE